MIAVLVLLLQEAAVPGAPAEGASLKAGFAQVRITPGEPLWLAGYGARTRPMESTDGELWAKALVLEDAAGSRAALVTLDLAGVWPWFVDAVREAVRGPAKLRPEAVVVNCSHNHSAPVLSLDDRSRAGWTDEEIRRTAAWTRGVMAKVVAIVVEAAGRLEPVRLAQGTGAAGFVMNRREFGPAGVRIGVNPRGYADRSVPVLRAEADDGSLRGIVFGAACHNTTLGHRSYRLHGDYAGEAQAWLDRRHSGACAMFVMGCGGDANPHPRGGDDELDEAKRHGAALGAEVERVLGGLLAPVRGPLRIERSTARLPFARPDVGALKTRAADPNATIAGVARGLLERLEKGDPLPEALEAPVSVWQFGRDLTFVALSGEVVSGYVPLLERALGPRGLWLAAYCDDVFGYLPSAADLAEGGYETMGLPGKGVFAPEAEGALVTKVVELARAAGRRTP